jgi:indolepyruvate ferredoxin oxidoreductase
VRHSEIAHQYELSDRYLLEDGRVFLSGVQALARLPLDQLRADRRAGLRTAAFVSGYQGSPLAGYGDAAMAAARLAPELPVVVQPAVNEELAATAVMGSQLATTLDDCRYDGIVGVWYGKAPGLDRAGDAIRHAVFAGTAPRGGVVALIGDDPAAKSSTLPSSSDATLVDLHIPILYPGDVQEVVDLGRHAVELSRASGLWTSLKVVASVADGTGTVELHPDRLHLSIPTMEVDGRPFVPRPSGRLLTPFTLDVEREFQQVRVELARRYGVDNHLNTVAVRGRDDWIGFAACGHTYHELREALALVGLADAASLNRAGVRLLQLHMPVPLDAGVVRRFAEGLAEIVVVEEKNPTLEWLIKEALYDQAERPVVVGKCDDAGAPLIPGTGAIDADSIVTPVRQRLARRLDQLAPVPVTRERISIPVGSTRSPYFCSGCPHNTSTKVPDGTLVGGGIGCHAMVALMEPERVGEVVGLTAMGNEGAQWIGMAPFVGRDHFVQNLGDGTYFHSGSLAVRAAVAAGVNLTYKLLYNHTVAMTGGQDAKGAIAVPELVRQLLLEGVRKVVVTTDDLGRYRGVTFPEGVEIRPRADVVEVQRELAAVGGVTVLVHDQECAAEKRRARTRGKRSTPKRRVLIDERVCEGCGDCGAKSNCLSVQPVPTPFGRKTRIHQTSCNLDLSCLEGDCPSFATVRPARRRRVLPGRSPTQPVSPPAGSAPPRQPPPVPDPPFVEVTDWALRLSGIGGTGVITVSQVIGTAALLEGWTVRGLDQTGLSQKAGPVVSDLRLCRAEPAASNKAPGGQVDGYLAFDLLVAAGEAHLVGVSADRTVVVGSLSSTPTGEMVVHPDRPGPDIAGLRARVDARTSEHHYLDALGLAHALFGDTTTANLLLVGAAVQLGAVPVGPAALERAIELNGVAVERNVAAFRWGRAWAHDPGTVEAIAAGGAPSAAALDWADEPVPALVERLAVDLADYESPALARRYRAVVERVGSAEAAAVPGSDALTGAVARNLYRLMAIKDEYEVARLLLRPEARAGASAVAGPGARVTWRLHPPMLRAMGVRRKLALGPWARPALVVLRSSRRVRGRWFDPFGHTRLRRLERALVPEYVAAVDELITHLGADTLHEAVVIAELPDQVRGFEELKLRRIAQYRGELTSRLADHRHASALRGSTVRA